MSPLAAREGESGPGDEGVWHLARWTGGGQGVGHPEALLSQVPDVVHAVPRGMGHRPRKKSHGEGWGWQIYQLYI